MKTAIKVTQILPMFLIGMIIAGAVDRQTAMWVSGIILLIIDVVIGVVMQFNLDKKNSRKMQDVGADWNSLTFEEKREIARDILEKSKQDVRDSGIDIDEIIEQICDDLNRECKLGKYSDSTSESINESVEEKLCHKMDAIVDKLKAEGRERFVQSIDSDEAGRFLIEVCNNMSYAPARAWLTGLFTVRGLELCGKTALEYGFKSTPGSMGQIVMLHLVQTANSKIRLFTSETSGSRYALCEYANGSHINYGIMNAHEMAIKFMEILKK